MPDIARHVEEARSVRGGLSALLAARAEPLPEMDDPAFGALFDRFADARVVLLGEASHGTSEFYCARAAITRRLIERHGFNVVGLEADWPDARVLDARARHRAPPPRAADAFRRFPTWMWRNREFDQFLEWLSDHNRSRGPAGQAGIYGLDLYNLAASMRTVIDYLDREDPDAAKVARERYGCLTPWAEQPAAYGHLTLSGRYAGCEGAVNAMLREMLQRSLHDGGGDPEEALLDATQSARLVADAEAYYRAMYYGGAESWNLRDTHMFETLQAILEAKGPDAKAVVWAHNSHIGDARATEMGAVREELNIGQLCREAYGQAARLIGFGADSGTVACASDWDEPVEVKQLRPGLPDSVERLSHGAGISRFLLDLRPGVHEDVRQALADPRVQRFIGVIYRPETERWSHYAEARLSEQFDAWVWFDETRAVSPLETAAPAPDEGGAEDTWPFGV
ncbi:erythromycin esterase family protein [Phenylobacterium sp. J426]|uniref:erythromycin esterase family protein n=1 Tax=Phenylobacterium sp. J426 TaxID=2898439 RepID=UPI002150D384|nr:erythromycin esterase family protein [Phenylobacterium sp. J426]MCR5874240.1 erythromycin esterase family protein [Phenylobacterium sp. J426]